MGLEPLPLGSVMRAAGSPLTSPVVRAGAGREESCEISVCGRGLVGHAAAAAAAARASVGETLPRNTTTNRTTFGYDSSRQQLVTDGMLLASALQQQLDGVNAYQTNVHQTRVTPAPSGRVLVDDASQPPHSPTRSVPSALTPRVPYASRAATAPFVAAACVRLKRDGAAGVGYDSKRVGATQPTTHGILVGVSESEGSTGVQCNNAPRSKSVPAASKGVESNDELPGNSRECNGEVRASDFSRRRGSGGGGTTAASVKSTAATSAGSGAAAVKKRPKKSRKLVLPFAYADDDLRVICVESCEGQVLPEYLPSYLAEAP